MADKLITVNVGREVYEEGKTINVYGSYANALSHGATGLSTILGVDKLTGLVGASITQVAKTTGLTANQAGFISFFAAEDTPYFLMSDGMWGEPRKILTND